MSGVWHFATRRRDFSEREHVTLIDVAVHVRHSWPRHCRYHRCRYAEWTSHREREKEREKEFLHRCRSRNDYNSSRMTRIHKFKEDKEEKYDRFANISDYISGGEVERRRIFFGANFAILDFLSFFFFWAFVIQAPPAYENEGERDDGRVPLTMPIGGREGHNHKVSLLDPCSHATRTRASCLAVITKGEEGGKRRLFFFFFSVGSEQARTRRTLRVNTIGRDSTARDNDLLLLRRIS